MKKEVKEEIHKGKEKELLKSRGNQIDEEITLSQLKVELEKRNEIIEQLQKDNESLKEELTQVKKRNKKLYQILSQGESKSRKKCGIFFCKSDFNVLFFVLCVCSERQGVRSR